MTNTKKFPVAMLPTTDAQSPFGLQANGVLKFVGAHGLNGLGVGIMQHLYAYSKDPIEKSEKNFWAINANLDYVFFVNNPIPEEVEYPIYKIIASTNKEITPSSLIPDIYLSAYIRFFNDKDALNAIDIEVSITSKWVNSVSPTGIKRQEIISLDTTTDGYVIIGKPRTEELSGFAAQSLGMSNTDPTNNGTKQKNKIMEETESRELNHLTIEYIRKLDKSEEIQKVKLAFAVKQDYENADKERQKQTLLHKEADEIFEKMRVIAKKLSIYKIR